MVMESISILLPLGVFEIPSPRRGPRLRHATPSLNSFRFALLRALELRCTFVFAWRHLDPLLACLVQDGGRVFLRAVRDPHPAAKGAQDGGGKVRHKFKGFRCHRKHTNKHTHKNNIIIPDRC